MEAMPSHRSQLGVSSQMVAGIKSPLAPSEVPVGLRQNRYVGNDLATTLASFDEPAQTALKDVYGLLRRALRITRDGIRDQQPLRVSSELSDLDWMNRVRKLKNAFNAKDQALPSRERKVLHDLRGGALASATLQQEMISALNTEVDIREITILSNLVRDHLKIMRNCLRDLDPKARAKDEQLRLHAIQLIYEKWDNTHVGGKIVSYHGVREGQIASCCLEFSTLDRVIYNLVNNAIRYTADDHVDIHTSFVEPENPATLFVAVTNSISNEQEVALKRQFGDEMGKLSSAGSRQAGTVWE